MISISKAHKPRPKPRFLKISKIGKLLKKAPSMNFKIVKTKVSQRGNKKFFFRLSKVLNFRML